MIFNYFMGFEVNVVSAVLVLAFYFWLKQTYYDDGEYTKLDFLENPIFWGNWEKSNLLLCHLAFYSEPSLSVTHDCRYSELWLGTPDFCILATDAHTMSWMWISMFYQVVAQHPQQFYQ
jgi:hypothetical protein